MEYVPLPLFDRSLFNLEVDLACHLKDLCKDLQNQSETQFLFYLIKREIC